MRRDRVRVRYYIYLPSFMPDAMKLSQGRGNTNSFS
jgi:hypothetical protein